MWGNIRSRISLPTSSIDYLKMMVASSSKITAVAYSFNLTISEVVAAVEHIFDAIIKLPVEHELKGLLPPFQEVHELAKIAKILPQEWRLLGLHTFEKSVFWLASILKEYPGAGLLFRAIANANIGFIDDIIKRVTALDNPFSN